VEEIAEINSRLKELEADMKKDFPLTPVEAAEMRADLREYILAISEIEQKAIESLQGSMK
jgi:hypothetical protein